MLLVVTSLLDAAATVVYVNKEQTTVQANQALSDRNQSLGQQLSAARDDASAARAQLLVQQQSAAKDATDTQASLNRANADLAAKIADYSQLLRNSQAQEANLQELNAQLAIALATNKEQTQTVNDLRDSNGKLLQGQAESDAAVARQRQLAETYGRQVEYLGEQLKKAQDLIKAYSGVLTDNHLTLPTEPAQSFGGPAVSGVVQDKQAVNGVTYLTISVGSSDNVQAGMQFKVVDTSAQPNQFLGILTITRADANTAVGRLQADAQLSDRVQKGNEVTTDLQ
jgi:hypothetical protein